jgi:citrate synthase
MTAKMVIASAKRLIEVRQFCRKRKRIAEISVPAWPMPTQNTKLTMGKPQATGWLLPQTPTPVRIRYPMSRPSIPSSETEIAKQMYQALGGRRRSAMEQTFSVTDEKSLPPSTSGARFVGSSVVLSRPCTT